MHTNVVVFVYEMFIFGDNLDSVSVVKEDLHL